MTGVQTVFASLLAAGNSTSSKTTTSGDFESLLFLVVIFAAGYFLFIRPRSQAARRQRDTLMELRPGDEVLTGAGIFGSVVDVESDRVTLETAPDTRITVLRSTIARRLTDHPADDETTWDEDDEHEAHEAYEAEHDDHDEDADHDEGADHDEHDAGAGPEGKDPAHDQADDQADDHVEGAGTEEGNGAGGPTANGRGGVTGEAGGSASAEERPS